MENDPFIDGLPIKNGGSFHGYVSHNPRVIFPHDLSIWSNQSFGSIAQLLFLLQAAVSHGAGGLRIEVGGVQPAFWWDYP